MVVSLLGRWAPWRCGSLASPLAAALCVYFFFFYPYPLALAAFVGPLRVRVYLLLFVCPWVCGMCVCGGGGVLSGGVWFPPFGSVRVSLIPCFFLCGRRRVKRVENAYVGGWAAVQCLWRQFVRRRVVYTLACLRRLSWRVRAWAYLLCVFHGVSWFPCFFVWCFAFGGFSPLDAFTHLDLACLMASSSYACGGC